MKKMGQLVLVNLRIRLFVVFASSMFLATGCPELSVTELSLVPGSAGEGKFTLLARAEADYEREMCELKENGRLVNKDCEHGPEVISGTGLLGIWLPEGWQVDEARLSAALGGETEVLVPMEYLAKAFPQTFPYAPGKWWPFITDCQDIKAGVTVFNIEFDVLGDKSAEQIGVGIALTNYWAEEEGISVEDVQMTASIRPISGTIESREIKTHRVLPDPVQDEKVKWCKYEPEPVERGLRGCSCNSVGNEDIHQSRLLPVLLSLLG